MHLWDSPIEEWRYEQNQHFKNIFFVLSFVRTFLKNKFKILVNEACKTQYKDLASQNKQLQEAKKEYQKKKLTFWWCRWHRLNTVIANKEFYYNYISLLNYLKRLKPLVTRYKCCYYLCCSMYLEVSTIKLNQKRCLLFIIWNQTLTS